MAVSVSLAFLLVIRHRSFFYDSHQSTEVYARGEISTLNVVRSALSFLIRKRGVVGEAQLEELFEFYRSKKGVTMDREKFQEFLEKAALRLNQHEQVLFVCTDSSCLKKILVTPSESSLTAISQEFGCAVEPTGCHWHCDKAPVMTYKSGTNYETFLDCSNAERWQVVKNFVSTDQAKPDSLRFA